MPEPQEWRAIAENQDGAVARGQLLGLGLSARQSRRYLDSGHWQVLHPGVYLTHAGPVLDRARLWAAVLYAGEGAAVAGRSALWLAGLRGDRPEPDEIAVPWSRQVRSRPGLKVRRQRDLARRAHPAAQPPRVRLEAALLEVTARDREADPVIDLVLRVVQQRLTTAGRIRAEFEQWPRHRWRGLMFELLTAAVDGVASPLELRYARAVEEAHRLPRGRRNLKRPVTGRARYRDVAYPEQRLVVELDGREAHPLDQAFRDLRRDNEVVVSGEEVLRYGWRDVAGRPCQVAGQVGAVLRRNGWPGRETRCGPACDLPGPAGPAP